MSRYGVKKRWGLGELVQMELGQEHDLSFTLTFRKPHTFVAQSYSDRAELLCSLFHVRSLKYARLHSC